MAFLNWTIQALEDLENIGEFIERESPKYAKIQVERIVKAIKVLENHPEFGRPVPELENKEIREILMGSYRIIYKLVGENQIDILTIYHSRRILDRHLF